MAVNRLAPGMDATWNRAWVCDTTAERTALLATFGDPLGPKRGDMILDNETSQLYMVTNGASDVQITGLVDSPVDLANDVTGVLPVDNGGTGLAAVTVNRIPFGDGTNPLQTDADLTFNGTELNVNALVDISGAAGGQIEFPATENPSANVNTLDDYQEGTFDTDLSFGGLSTGITYSGRTFTYTKVGRQVCVCGLIVLTSKGSATGDSAFTLPFPVSSGNEFASANGMNFTSFAATVNNAIASCINGTSTAFIFQTAAGTTTRLNDTDFTNTSVLVIQVNYFTG